MLFVLAIGIPSIFFEYVCTILLNQCQLLSTRNGTDLHNGFSCRLDAASVDPRLVAP